ncbi:methyltransferase domain-containing protein [Spiractinospora alimapuensis]|uniref:class I SAM-dependent methyltransferase n=1 Tax=Spiractinospora alimapuensis TaxID=2820884 RepID=UPI001F2F861D|nr:methyltransferase domain-containing protein [Spiractinospora alimapuensis]QVQ51572.1 methyltransferase domain-containing protein [Spiractinospora alimapuensis]
MGEAPGAYVPELLDGYSTAMLAATGVGPGHHCLQLGPEGGAVAQWLAGRVTPGGRVVAALAGPGRRTPPHGIEVVSHDIATEPPPRGPFDVIHARLVVPHLARRRDVLHQILDALRPGGWLVVGDFHGPIASRASPAASSHGASDTDLFAAVLNDVHGRVNETGAGDRQWIGTVERHLDAAGMQEVHAASYDQVVRGGESACVLLRDHVIRIHDRLLRLGHRQCELRRFHDLMLDPGFSSWFHEFRCVRVRKPVTTYGARPVVPTPHRGVGSA